MKTLVEKFEKPMIKLVVELTIFVFIIEGNYFCYIIYYSGWNKTSNKNNIEIE